MKRIALHLVALAVFLPCTLIVCGGSVVVNLLGVVYLAWLVLVASRTDTGRRFIRRYYHEILRLENFM